MRNILLIVIIFCCRPAASQTTFIKDFGIDSLAEDGNAVIQAADSGYYVLGYKQTNGGYTGRGLLMRTDKQGNELWTKYYSYTGASHLRFDNFSVTSDGNFVVTGLVYYNVSDFDAYLAKIDTAGNVLWEKNYGGLYRQQGNCVKETFDKGFVICGYTDSLGTSTAEMYVIKTDSLGDSLWARNYSNDQVQYGYAIVQASDSGFVVVGAITPVGSVVSKAYAIRISKYGDTLWTKTINQPNTGLAADVRMIANDHFVVGGSGSVPGLPPKPFMAEYDAAGNEVWSEVYNDGPHGHGGSIAKTDDNGYIMAGRDTSGNFYVIKTDMNGAQQWFRKIDVSYSDWSACIRQTSDGGFILTGDIIDNTTNWANIVLIKLDGNGHLSAKTVGAKSSSNLSIHPNPTTGSFTLTATATSTGKTAGIEITDVFGKLMYSSQSKITSGTISREIHLDDIAPGMYFLKLRTESGEEGVKLVKD